eukprot:m.56062 g.56062  ORF g.56062 m.56062 type:complete len:86 (-) comp11536_c2_seq2:443-700(-)
MSCLLIVIYLCVISNPDVAYSSLTSLSVLDTTNEPITIRLRTAVYHDDVQVSPLHCTLHVCISIFCVHESFFSVCSLHVDAFLFV